MAAPSIDLSLNNFQSVVLEGSYKKLVLVDFWAPWCAPCRTLMPLLHKLADTYKAKLVLAKVNTDEERELAMQFGIRGIPHVKAFLNGNLVDEFSGVLPEEEIRQFIERHLPSPIDKLMSQAEAALTQGDMVLAQRLLNDVLTLDTGHDAAKLLVAFIAIEQKDFPQARHFLSSLSPTAQNEPQAIQLQARLAFAERAGGLPNIETLKEAIAGDEKNFQARLDLANAYIAEGVYEAALDQLLDIVRRNRGFAQGAARKLMLDVFALLGNQGELVARYRKKLAMALT